MRTLQCQLYVPAKINIGYTRSSIGTFESSRYFHMVVITALEINTGSDNDLLSTEHCLNFRRS